MSTQKKLGIGAGVIVLLILAVLYFNGVFSSSEKKNESKPQDSTAVHNKKLNPGKKPAPQLTLEKRVSNLEKDNEITKQRLDAHAAAISLEAQKILALIENSGLSEEEKSSLADNVENAASNGDLEALRKENTELQKKIADLEKKKSNEAGKLQKLTEPGWDNKDHWKNW